MPADHPTAFFSPLKPDEPLIIDGLDWSWMFVIFRDVPGFPGYKAGTDGSAWSCRTKQGLVNTWHRLTPLKTGRRGYQFAFTIASQTKHLGAHRVILTTFYGPCPEGMEGCHNDGNFANNNLHNLRWDTHKGNVNDRIRHGTMPIGEKNPRAKIGPETVEKVRKFRSGGMILRQIAFEVGLSKRMVKRILDGKNWKSVPLQNTYPEEVVSSSPVTGYRRRNGTFVPGYTRKNHGTGVLPPETDES
jgi:hypothetical protein